MYKLCVQKNRDIPVQVSETEFLYMRSYALQTLARTRPKINSIK